MRPVVLSERLEHERVAALGGRVRRGNAVEVGGGLDQAFAIAGTSQ
jgi:hypothetical protein